MKCSNESWLHSLAESKTKDLDISDKGTGKDVNPYWLVENLNKESSPDCIIIPDVGWQVTTLNQQSKLKLGQQMFSSWANSPMGYAVAAGIGAHFSNKQKEIIIHIGDGGLQLNLQDLQTVSHYEIPLKIFLWNNYGYATIQAFQDGSLDQRYHATDLNHGYSAPDFEELAKLYKLQYFRVDDDSEVKNTISNVLDASGPVLCEVIMDIDFRPKPALGAEKAFDGLEPSLEK